MPGLQKHEPGFYFLIAVLNLDKESVFLSSYGFLNLWALSKPNFPSHFQLFLMSQIVGILLYYFYLFVKKPLDSIFLTTHLLQLLRPTCFSDEKEKSFSKTHLNDDSLSLRIKQKHFNVDS